jgi:hypothetical protein
MKKRGRGRPPVDDRHKIGLSISEAVLQAAKTAAIKSRRTLSKFFEIAACKEIERVNATPETQL